MWYGNRKAITGSGEIINVDPYQMRGVGLPDGWQWLDDIDADTLLSVVRDLDRRLRTLEDKSA